jgi:hypothetical protein
MIRSAVCFFVVVVAGSLISGCNQSPKPSESATVGVGSDIVTGDGIVHVERSPDAEALLTQLASNAWVFKHRGGELTAELIVSHRPAGPDQKETTIFEADGNLEKVGALNEAFLKNGTDIVSVGADTSGYLIVAIPSDSEWQTHALILSRGNFGSSKISKKASDLVLDLVGGDSGKTRKLSAGSILGQPLALAPGDTKIIVDHFMYFEPDSTKSAIGEMEAIHTVLTVSARKKGELTEAGVAK